MRSEKLKRPTANARRDELIRQRNPAPAPARPLLGPGAAPVSPAGVLQMQRAAGNRATAQLLSAHGAAGLVQRKLWGARGEQVTDATLGLPPDKKPSPVTVRLLADAQDHYLPDDPKLVDLSAPLLRTLDKKKYLLGETHGDGSFERRTAPWSYVPRMLEGVKVMTGQSAREQVAVDRGQTADTRRGLPLEDLHPYALVSMLAVQQALNAYGQKLTPAEADRYADDFDWQDQLSGLQRVVWNYYRVAQEWQGLSKTAQDSDDPTGRLDHFVDIANAFVEQEFWRNTLVPVNEGKKKVGQLDPDEIKAMQRALAVAVPHVIELIDTRPMGGGWLGFGQSRQGPEPIANRTRLEELSQRGPKLGTITAVDEANKLREPEMARKIRAAPAPLFVRVGDAHVNKLDIAVGEDAVPVGKNDDFDIQTTDF